MATAKEDPPMSLSYLKKLLLYKKPQDPNNSKAQQQLLNKSRKQRICVQLSYWGIPYSSKVTLATTEKILKEAIKLGKCDKETPRIVEYHRKADEIFDHKVDWENEAIEDEENFDEKWEWAMEEHRDFVKEMKKMKPAKKSASKESASSDVLSKCGGSYIIRCERMSSQEGSDIVRTIDIQSSGPTIGILSAAVAFRFLEGTMLLSASETELDEYIEQVDAAGDSDSDGEGYDYDNDNDEGASGSKKRKASSNFSGKGNRLGGAPEKKAKTTESLETASASRRIYFRFRGRDDGEGEIVSEAHKGYFDFTEDEFVLKGKADIPFIGTSIDIEGIKVAATARNSAEPWNTFSEAAHEREWRWRRGRR